MGFLVEMWMPIRASAAAVFAGLGNWGAAA
jgi:hypothetical protein